MKPLYQISTEYQRQLNEMMDADEITLEMENAIKQSSDDLDKKIQCCAAKLMDIKAEREMVSSHIAKLELREKQLLKQLDWLEQYISSAMKDYKDKIKATEEMPFNVVLRKNQESLDIFDKTATIPFEFVKHKMIETVDKIGLKKAMQNGLEVEGIRLMNTYSVVVGPSKIIPGDTRKARAVRVE